MEIEINNIGKLPVAILKGEGIVIHNVEDALDAIGNTQYGGADRLIIYQKNLSPDFFDLKTRLAGEILQKFSQYEVRLAVVGDFSQVKSNSLRDFIYESNKFGRINFVNSLEEAIRQLRDDQG